MYPKIFKVVDGCDERLPQMVAAMEEVFRSVAPAILSGAGNTDSVDKDDGSPVTEVDRVVEKTIMERFNSSFEDVMVFGEEAGYSEVLPEQCWLLDPIDGTKAFVAGEPTFTTMAVYIENEQAIASVLYDPSSDRMYTAVRGQGAYCNESRLDLTKQSIGSDVLCKGRHVKQLDALLSSANVTCKIAPTGGGYGFMLVATGLAAARVQLHSRGYLHDYAPGALLVAEAGGALIPIVDSTYTFRSKSFVACHPALVATVQSAVEEIKLLELAT